MQYPYPRRPILLLPELYAGAAAGGSKATTLLFNSSYRNSAPAMLHLLDAAVLADAAPGLDLSARVSDLPTVPGTGKLQAYPA